LLPQQLLSVWGDATQGQKDFDQHKSSSVIHQSDLGG
jgi:hypothetical protein